MAAECITISVCREGEEIFAEALEAMAEIRRDLRRLTSRIESLEKRPLNEQPGAATITEIEAG